MIIKDQHGSFEGPNTESSISPERDAAGRLLGRTSLRAESAEDEMRNNEKLLTKASFVQYDSTVDIVKKG